MYIITTTLSNYMYIITTIHVHNYHHVHVHNYYHVHVHNYHHVHVHNYHHIVKLVCTNSFGTIFP